MDKFDLWRLRESLSISEASLLLMGLNPSEVDLDSLDKNPLPDYKTWDSVLCEAIGNWSLKANIARYDEYPEISPDEINWSNTTIDVIHLKKWLEKKNKKNNFFFQVPHSYIDPKNKFYANKLHAAVDAWSYVSLNIEKFSDMTPKQALEDWLIKNADTYKLKNKDGSPNSTAIEEICKIANWRPEGGNISRKGKT